MIQSSTCVAKGKYIEDATQKFGEFKQCNRRIKKNAATVFEMCVKDTKCRRNEQKIVFHKDCG